MVGGADQHPRSEGGIGAEAGTGAAQQVRGCSSHHCTPLVQEGHVPPGSGWGRQSQGYILGEWQKALAAGAMSCCLTSRGSTELLHCTASGQAARTGQSHPSLPVPPSPTQPGASSGRHGDACAPGSVRGRQDQGCTPGG